MRARFRVATPQAVSSPSTAPRWRADNSAPIKGLFWGGGGKQLGIQFMGSAIITVSVLVVSLAMFYAIKQMGLLRISEEGEREGIDIHEHGAPAYHPEPAFLGSMPSYSTSSPVPSASYSVPVTKS